jgi:hypothetical protein
LLFEEQHELQLLFPLDHLQMLYLPQTPRVLVIDDEDDANLLFRIVLQDNGFKIDTFSNPLIALENF